MKEQALKYLSLGVSIIPLRKNKKPYLNAWKIYQARKATEEEVEQWWIDYPDAQIGIVTGAISNLAVVDVEFGGDKTIFPETDMVTTGNGGWHLYYTYVEGVENKTRAYPLTDVRGEGGYVVAPPSVTEYWKNGELKGGKYEYVFPLKGRRPFPSEMFGIKEKQSLPTQWAEVVGGVAEGSRNDQATKLAGKLFNAFHPREWESTVWVLLKAWNAQNNPPLTEYELRNIYRSIGNRDLKNDREKQEEDTPIMLLSEAVRNIPILPTTKTGYESFDYCLSGGFKQGELIIISGPTANGKTTFAQTLTYHLASNGVSSLWFSYEMGLREIWEKFTAMGVDEKFLAYVPFKLTNDRLDWIEKKIIEAKVFGVKAVFIDHLGFLSGTPKKMTDNFSQNLSAYLGSICREIKIMAVKHDMMIFVIAHTRKTEKPSLNDISSSAGIAQEANTVFIVWRERLDVDDEGEDVLSPNTKISLEKNRATGRTKRIMCTLSCGKLEQIAYEKKEVKVFKRLKDESRKFFNDI